MDEQAITKLYLQRDEAAITQTQQLYGAYCYRIAWNILRQEEDARECVNDTLLLAWQSIPANPPAHLKPYLAKLARNQALNRLRAEHAQKRSSGTDAIMDELSEIVEGGVDAESETFTKELAAAVGTFLSARPQQERSIFLARYFSCDTYAVIAKRHRLSETAARMRISRTRKELKTYLLQEGWIS